MKTIARMFYAVMFAVALTACVPQAAVQPGQPGTTVKQPSAEEQLLRDIVAAQISLTTAINGLADMHDAEVNRQKAVALKDPNASTSPIISEPAYANAKQLAQQTNGMLKAARDAAAAKDSNYAQTLLVAATNLITQIATVNGGKK